ncbi:hypothetical protein Patl1_20257 [Pistacia atlantica]|uniref:Uncharacterized protein n=1 Tax=Pistacia atlantica TaxID=434234 RepID=A0ACC1BN68_9ROSI|nr:hypothetical protein Patl1_20257 [Pistacia atlantica]
MQRIIACN